MMRSLRRRRQAGRYALVDGIPFRLPIASHQSPALMAAFSVDAGRAGELLPGNELHPLRVTPHRGVLLVTVIDYRLTNIGAYIEFSIGIACTRGPRPTPPLVPGLVLALLRSGQYVVDLPVSTEISVKGGKGIWGMPKHQANLDFVVDDHQASSQYDLDGVLAMRIEVERPGRVRVPVAMTASNYCQFRGLLLKSSIAFRGMMEASLGRPGSARLHLGPHPRMDALRRLDLSDEALFTGFLPSSRGVLDDHVEGWFLTAEQPPRTRPEGLESVVDLGLGRQWLPPPRRAEDDNRAVAAQVGS